MSKIKDLAELVPIVRGLQREGKQVVFTNGCFDLLHLGHIRLLQQGKSLGDVLVVGVNSDSSMRQIKGEARPIVPADERLEVLSALEVVDHLFLFDEPDPGNAIAQLRPDILVKGGDWREEEVVGRDTVQSYGGRVVTLPYYGDHSTTKLIELVVERYSSPGGRLRRG